jgi:hypothetical protein
VEDFMTTERLVKWSKEAKKNFEKAEDKSVVLDYRHTIPSFSVYCLDF